MHSLNCVHKCFFFNFLQIIKPIHMCASCPDAQSVATYLGYFCNQKSPGNFTLLQWVNEKIPSFNIRNFSTDWNNGHALWSLMNVVSGGSISISDNSKPLELAELSLNLSSKFKVPPIISSNDLIDPGLDPLRLMAYLVKLKSVIQKGI